MKTWLKRRAERWAGAAGPTRDVRTTDKPVRSRFRAVPTGDVPVRTRLFRAHQPPPGVRGDGATLAMDGALNAWLGAQPGVASRFIEDGLGFQGYADLSAMMLRAEFRKPVETIAREATRAWIRFRYDNTGTKGDVTDRLQQIEAEFTRLNVRDIVRRQVVHALGYGVGYIWVGMTGSALNSDAQSLPLMINAYGVQPGQVERLANIDPIWTAPNAYNADNPLRVDYYRPRNWWVQGVLVDRTRLLSMTPFEVPDILKPAFNFGGLALTQMLQAYVHNFLRTRQSVSDLVSNFATKVLKTDMTGNMQTQGGMGYGDIDADGITSRVAAMNAWANNNGTFVLDKQSEDFDIKAAPLSGLDALQAQAMECMAGIPGIPLVKLFGIQPAGLNASSDGEIRVFYDEISAFQQAHMRPTLNAIFHLAQLNLWGKIDPSLDFEFVPLWQMSEKESAELEQVKSSADATNIASGKINAREARAREASSPTSLYRNVDLSGEA